MKYFLSILAVSVAHCGAQLPSNYLPPKSTGAGNFLAKSDSYAPPPSGPVLRAFASAPAGIPVAILRFASKNDGDGNYSFEYESENGIYQEERGANGVVIGSYSYVAPDGHNYTVHYIADENGFRPKGDHIPTTAIAAASTTVSPGNVETFGNNEDSNRQYLPPPSPSGAQDFEGYHY